MRAYALHTANPYKNVSFGGSLVWLARARIVSFTALRGM